MSESFLTCEANATSAEASAVSQLAEQAAAQGITYIVGTGDTGSAGCDNLSETQATGPLSVNLLASTPFNVAVGGTQFNEHGSDSLYWSTTNNQYTLTSALSYIPEDVWNESCTVAQCGQANANIAAGGGGASTYFTKPSWQASVPGIPNDGMRDVPDVALTAAALHDPYLLCLDGSCVPDAQGNFSFFAVGGTSAAAPSFAGIVALVNAAVVGLNSPPRLGQINPVLYGLAAKENLANCNGSSISVLPATTCIFNDVTVGNNAVPGESGYGTASAEYPSGTGYDLATGLGSVNVANLVKNWTTTFNPTSTTLTINPTSFMHGTPVQVNISVTSPDGTPTGDVALYTSSSVGSAVPGNSFTIDRNGSASATIKSLPGGGLYTATAHYAGDGTFGWSDSSPVRLTITPENSSTFLHLVTPGPSGGAVYTENTAAYGSPYVLRGDVTNVTDGFNIFPVCSSGCPTGSATITVNGQALDAGTFQLNSLGYAEDQHIQLSASSSPYALHAAYLGDPSFNSSSTGLSVTITQAQSATSLTANPSTGVTTATPVLLTATVATQSNSSVGPSGTVTFFGNGIPGPNVPVTSIPASPAGPASATAWVEALYTAGTWSVTAKYNGDTNYATSQTSNPLSITVTQALPSPVATASPVSVTAGGSANTTVTVTPTGGFTGQVTVSCPSATLPPGVTCNTLNVTVSGSTAVQGQLLVSVEAPSAPGSTAEIQSTGGTQSARWRSGPTGRNGWWKLGVGSGLTAIFLFIVPGRRRYRATLGLGLICAVSFTIGCGGGGGGTGPVGGVATTTKITVPVTKAAQGTSLSFDVSVTASGATPGATVQLFDGTTALGAATPLTSGAATINTSALSVGTHQISAHYLGDANTMASQSGTVNVTLTGTTSVGIVTTPASSNSNATFALTIN